MECFPEMSQAELLCTLSDDTLLWGVLAAHCLCRNAKCASKRRKFLLLRAALHYLGLAKPLTSALPPWLWPAGQFSHWTSPLASHCLLLSTGMWLKEPSQPNSLAQDPCLPSSLLPLYSHFLCPSISHPYRAVLSSSLPIHPPCSFLLWGPLSMLSPELPLLASLFPSNCSFPQCLLLFFPLSSCLFLEILMA